MHQPTSEEFKVRDPRFSSPRWPYWMLLGVAVSGAISFFTNSETPLLVLVPVAMIFVYINGQKNQARIVLHTDQHTLTIEVVKAGLEMPLSSTAFSWQDLAFFQYAAYAESDDLLYLKWQDATTSNFSGGDIKAFHHYLHVYFPEKEQQTANFPN